MNRSKKSLFNMFFGIFNQVIVLVLGLVVPKLFIMSYGSEVNGLQSTIAYIYTYIALLESGIGTATIQALYKPVANESREEINSILSATNLQYKRVALIYTVCMLFFAVAFPLTVSSSLDSATIGVMILLSGIGSLISFLFFGKFVLLLQADGRSYFVSIIALIAYVLKDIVKIILILCGLPVICVYVGNLVISVIIAVLYYYYKRKVYPWVSYKAKPNMKAISQSKNVLVHQISNIVCNSTDVLVLTYFIGNLKLVSVYNIYIMIFDAVKSLIINVFSSVTFIMGQTYNTDIEKYRRYHKIYEVADIAVSFALYSIAYVMMNPFLQVYTEGITDISYIDRYLPLLFALIKLLSSCREPALQLINYAGHFKQTQGRSVIETAINVVSSIVLSYFLGIYGVLLGTVIALTYRTIDVYIYTSRRFLNRSVWVSLKQWAIYMSGFAILIFVYNKISINVSGYFDFFLKAGIIGIMIGLFYFIYTCIFNLDIIKSVYNFAKRKIGTKSAR